LKPTSEAHLRNLVLHCHHHCVFPVVDPLVDLCCLEAFALTWAIQFSQSSGCVRMIAGDEVMVGSMDLDRL
jgi:hypothetical protein